MRLQRNIARALAITVPSLAAAQPMSGLFRWQVSRDGLAWSSSLTLNPGEPYKIRGVASWIDGATPSVGFAGCTFEQIDLIGADSSDVFGSASGLGGIPAYTTRLQGVAETWTIQAGTGASATGLKLDQVNPTARTSLGQLPQQLFRDGIPNPSFHRENPLTLLRFDAVAGVPKTLTLSATWTRLGAVPANEFKIYTTISGTSKKPIQEAVMTSAVVTILPAPAALAVVLLGLAGRRARPALTLALAGFALALAAPTARAQCDPAVLGPPDRLPGFDGDVRAFALWDPDGPGPRPELFLVAGQFDIAVDAAARNIAAWDGTSWSALGDGVGFIIRALAIYDNELYAGGSGGLARWDGAQWTIVNSTGSVADLAVYHGELYAGGAFAEFAGVPANNIARWNGSAWSALGSGIPVSTATSARALLVFNDRLIVGGQFTTAGGIASNHIAAWDGAAWSAMPGLPATVPSPGGVWALTIHDGALHAGGGFALGGLRSVARWAGSTWVGLDSNPPGLLYALASHAGRLIAAGGFTFSTPAGPANHIAAWNGSAWEPLGGGVDSTVVTLLSRAGLLYAGGLFASVEAGGVPALHLAAWDGVSWSAIADASAPFGTDESSEIRALTSWRGRLYAGGDDLVLDDVLLDGGIADWDGAAWSTLTPVEGEINALADVDDRLIAGGAFSNIGGLTAAGIAAWNGSAWDPLGGGVAGAAGRVNAVARFNGELIAAGSFHSAGAGPASNIAAWNGAAWRNLAEGVNAEVHALAVYNNELIAGGAFTSAGPAGQAAFHIARWDGQSWRPLADGGLNDPVFALAEHEGDLFIGGRFTESFDQSGLEYAVAWRGGDWIRLGPALLNPCTLPGYCTRSGIRAFARCQGRLFACGQVYAPGRAPAGSVIAWDGAAWTQIAAAPSAAASNMGLHALAVLGDDLHVGGNFESLGPQAHFDWARLRACRADLDCDRVIDFADYLEFLNLYDAQDSRVDFTADGVVDFADYLEFLNLYEAGC